MKQKFAIINFVLSVTVLFSVLFQSIHSYVHQSEINTEKITNQKKSEITNAHNITLQCAACDFHFSCFTAAEFFFFKFIKTIVVNKLAAIVLPQPSPYFTGSLFSLRAPPTL